MELTNDQREIVVDWITRYLIPTKTINTYFDSSEIRESFMDLYAKGFYIDKETLNEIMQELGYHAACFNKAPYLRFNVSNRSPALQEYRRRLLEQSAYEKYK